MIDYRRPFPVPAKAAEPILLRARYTKGERLTVIYKEVSEDVLTTYGPQETTETTRTEKEVSFQWRIMEVMRNGDARIAMQYTYFVAGVLKNGKPFAFLDSRLPQQSDYVKKFITIMTTPITITVSSRAKVVGVTGLDEILDRWRAEAEKTLSPQERAELDWLVEGLLGKENVAKTLSEVLTPFPAAPLDHTRTWSEPLNWPMEFLTMTGTRTYRLDSHPSLPDWYVVSEASKAVFTSSDKQLDFETVRGTITGTSMIRKESGRLVWNSAVLNLDLKTYGTKGDRPRAALSRMVSTMRTTATIRPTLTEQAKAHFDRGVALGRRGQFDAAIQEFDKAIALQPGAAELFGNRGIARHGRRDLAGAIKDLDHAIRLDPGLDIAHFGRAAARVDLKDYAGAIADHTAVIQLTPQYWRSYFLRGILYSLQEKWDAAIADFTGAIERNPEFPEVYRYRMTAYMRQGNMTAAEADLKKWRELGGRR
ncbi:MAG: tetratricopeptide repeat protein [Deltaproteobacteria bacterium]|nr:tetratricopeptide repeat protein [Deltaproteobacteria bacterium]